MRTQDKVKEISKRYLTLLNTDTELGTKDEEVSLIRDELKEDGYSSDEILSVLIGVDSFLNDVIFK